MNTEEYMLALGFKNFETSANTTDQTIQKIPTIQTIISEFDRDGPHVVLKKFGMWDDRTSIPYESIEYMKFHIYNEEFKSFDFLMSIEYNCTKTIQSLSTFIDHTDISECCAMYYIELFDLTGNKIDQNLYTIEIVPDLLDLDLTNSDLTNSDLTNSDLTNPEKFTLNLTFDDGQLCGDTYEELRYFSFSHKKGMIMNKILKKSNIREKKFIFTEYAKCIRIKFNKFVDFTDINVKVKVYNIYRYTGFFGSGWTFHM